MTTSKIGLEIHVQLNTKTKLFCSCPVSLDSLPNTNVCDICLGFPGSKPLLNSKALELGLKFSLACNCKLNSSFFFSRKTYFYPDMSKNYQITQYEVPIAFSGYISLESGKKINIRRIHLEEDPASLIHPSGIKKSSYVLIDYNRAGVPLVEIVTEPDFSNSSEVYEFLSKLETLLSYCGIVSKESSFKVDVNVSVSNGIRTETKNVSGKKDICSVVDYEVKRQSSSPVKSQETRLWDSSLGVTEFSRSKESESDYGYIFETDLPLYSLEDSYISKIKSSLPELPDKKRAKFLKLGLNPEYSSILSSRFWLAELFETLSKVDTQLAAQLLARDILGILNYNKLSFDDVSLSSPALESLLKLIKSRKVSDKNVKQSLISYLTEGVEPLTYLEKNDLLVKDDIDLDSVLSAFLKKNSKIVDDYRSGNQKAFNSLMGMLMRELKGKVDPVKLREGLEKVLKNE